MIQLSIHLRASPAAPEQKSRSSALTEFQFRDESNTKAGPPCSFTQVMALKRYFLAFSVVPPLPPSTSPNQRKQCKRRTHISANEERERKGSAVQLSGLVGEAGGGGEYGKRKSPAQKGD